MRPLGSVMALLASLAAAPGAAATAERLAPADAFTALRLSAELARAGEAARDPLLLLAAARLRRGAGVTLERGAADRAAEWIARAEALGGDDPRVASLAADLRATAAKGRTAGPRVTQALLLAGQRRMVEETFHAGRPAVVYIEGDGDSDLRLRVGSACRDMGPGDIKICTWTPAATEKVTIEIGNAGRVANRVILGTN